MSAIAREFDCTPSAISYIVRKAEAVGVEPTDSIAEPTPEPVAAPLLNTPIMNTPVINTLSLSNRLGNTPRPALALPDTNPTGNGAVGGSPPTASQPAPAVSPVPAAAAASGGSETPRSQGADAPPARPNQPPPVDATEARLRETARACLVAYRGWRQGPGEVSVQTLNDAVHDLRKVLARIEIDLSTSRREEQGMRPIPVPAHRAARQR